MEKLETARILKGGLAGLIGGLAASFVMSQFQALLSDLSEDGDSSDGSEETPANVKVADEVSETVFDHKLTKSEERPAGEIVHYAMGGVSGLIYGAAAEVDPMATVGGGLPFGAAVWMVADNIAVPALGFSKPMNEYPVSTHVYALSSHLVYGLTTEVVRRCVRPLL